MGGRHQVSTLLQERRDRFGISSNACHNGLLRVRATASHHCHQMESAKLCSVMYLMQSAAVLRTWSTAAYLKVGGMFLWSRRGVAETLVPVVVLRSTVHMREPHPFLRSKISRGRSVHPHLRESRRLQRRRLRGRIMGGSGYDRPPDLCRGSCLWCPSSPSSHDESTTHRDWRC